MVLYRMMPSYGQFTSESIPIAPLMFYLWRRFLWSSFHDLSYVTQQFLFASLPKRVTYNQYLTYFESVVRPQTDYCDKAKDYVGASRQSRKHGRNSRLCQELHTLLVCGRQMRSRLPAASVRRVTNDSILLNSRPLRALSEDPSNGEALTPGHPLVAGQLRAWILRTTGRVSLESMASWILA